MTHRTGKLDPRLVDPDSEVRMRQPHRPPPRSVFGSLVLIAVVVGAGAAAFAYTAGWFSPQRLTPTRLVDALTPAAGPSLGHRRNHAKGICFAGEFDANGAGSGLSRPRFSFAGSIRWSVASIVLPP